MIEVRGNLWDYPADVRVITTNGSVRKDGACVMGKGCALEAKNKYPGIDKILGALIQKHGNIPQFVYGSSEGIWSFPVKHKWMEKADLRLIENSALLISRGIHKNVRVVLPRPGCGNGQLKWEDVKPVLEPYLDDRFHVITF